MLIGELFVCFRYVLGWEDACAEAQEDADYVINSAHVSVQAAKAKRQSKAATRNDKAVANYPLRVNGVRSIVMGKDFDTDTAPQTQKLNAATAKEARHWADVINTAVQSLAHDAMSLGFLAGNAAVSARAVKLLVIEGGSGQANASKVSQHWL